MNNEYSARHIESYWVAKEDLQLTWRWIRNDKKIQVLFKNGRSVAF